MSIEQQKYYHSIGAGRSLVLVHGWGVDSAIWQPVIAQLSQHYCIYLVDLPGFSEEIEISDYSLEAMSDIILSKLPETAIWCGWSLGGLIATYIASHFPERVEKLIQVCASMKFVEQNTWLGVKEAVFDAFKNGLITSPQKTLNRFIALQAMGSDSVKNDIITIKQLLMTQPLPKASALMGGLDLLNKTDLRPEFSQLSMPCLSLFGKFDSLVPVANIRALSLLSKTHQQCVLDHSSHVPFISETALFNELIINFIDK